MTITAKELREWADTMRDDTEVFIDETGLLLMDGMGIEIEVGQEPAPRPDLSLPNAEYEVMTKCGCRMHVTDDEAVDFAYCPTHKGAVEANELLKRVAEWDAQAGFNDVPVFAEIRTALHKVGNDEARRERWAEMKAVEERRKRF